MKKLGVILLMLILGYIQVGYFVHSLHQRCNAKQEFKELTLSTLDDNTLDVFDLDNIKKDITWEENGKEFWFANGLYDVVKQKVVNGKTYLYCLKDQKEERVVEQQNTLTKNNAANTGKHSKTVKFSIPDFVMTESKCEGCLVMHAPLKFYRANTIITSKIKEPVSPPPQVS